MVPIMSEPYENACPASPLIRETALLTPFVMADIIPEIVEEILDFIELKAVVAALLMLLWNGISVLCWRERIDLCVILKHEKVTLFRMQRM